MGRITAGQPFPFLGRSHALRLRSHLQSSRLPWAVFTACSIIWGSTWLAIKAGLETIPPFTFVGIRYIIATMALAAIVKLFHARFPRDRLSWGIMLFLGIFQMSLPYGLVFWGEQYISSGLASILFATNPFFVVVFANFIVRNEKMTPFKILGVISSFLGMIIIFLPDITGLQSLAVQTSLFGGLALVASAALSGLSSVNSCRRLPYCQASRTNRIIRLSARSSRTCHT